MTRREDKRSPDATSSANSELSLRLRAEAMARGKAALSPENREVLSLEETQRTLHELQVHQIELEIQNEELRRVHVELDTARMRYFDLFDLAPVGYCTVSEQGLILEANLTAATLLGKARRALIGMPFSFFLVPEDENVYYRQRRQLLDSSVPRSFELRLAREDRSLFWARLDIAAAPDTPGAPVSRVVMSDITERKCSEQALAQASEKYRLALEAAALGAWEYRFDLGVMFCDDCFRKMFGLPGAGQIEYDQIIGCVHAADRAGVDEAVRQATVGVAGGDFNRSFRVVWPEGSVHWVTAHGRVSFEREGDSRRAVRFSGATMDITDRKRAEEALIQSEKLASVGRMAAAIAHEINNPLETVGHAVYLAGTDPGTSQKAKSYLDLATQELERIAHITKQTLAFNREDKEPTLVDLRGSVDSILKLFAARLKAKGISVEKRYAEVESIRASGGAIQQIISNLLSNSIDATLNHGKIQLRVSPSMGRNGSRLVRFTIADTGSGIPPGHLKRIFEAFFTTKEIVGNGLGLWVTKQIAEKHRATIRVRSKLGTGTVFSIAFPSASQAL